MKKVLLLVVIVLFVIIGCTNRYILKTQSITYQKSYGIHNVILSIEYPVDGNEFLMDSIRENIKEKLGNIYMGSIEDGEKMVLCSGDSLFKEYREYGKNFEGDVFVSEIFFHKRIAKLYENDIIITMIDSTEYCTGGPHPISHMCGSSYCKKNGQRFGYHMMCHTNRIDFHQLIKDGLKNYFCELNGKRIMSDKELSDNLLYDGDINSIPLPEKPPYLTDEGIMFIYQPYEIAGYTLGLPKFMLSYEDARPYLTQEALDLFFDN